MEDARQKGESAGGKKQEDRTKACGTAGGQDEATAAGERSAAVD